MSATSIRTFAIHAGSDLSVTLAIDTEVMTLDLAKLLNDFWSGNDAVLAASDDDLIQAVARRAAPVLMWATLDGYNEKGAICYLSEQEGWPENHGITLIDYEIPDFDAAYLEVTEVQQS